MNIRDLEYYQRLAYEKSFSKVADYYHVSQPTITYAIKRLENDLQVKLIERDRSHKTITLTPAGRQFSQHVNKILHEIRVTKREMSRYNSTQLPFGLPPIIGNHYFPRLTQYLLDQDILQHFKIVRDGSENLLRQIINGKVDIGIIGSLHPITNESLTSKLLVEKKFQIIVNKQHPFASRSDSGIFFKELIDEEFVLLGEQFVHLHAIQQLGESSNFDPEVIYQSDDLQILKSMIKNGVGIGFLAEIAIQPEDNLVALDLLDSQQPSFFISLVQRSVELSSPLLEKLSASIEQVFREDTN